MNVICVSLTLPYHILHVPIMYYYTDTILRIEWAIRMSLADLYDMYHLQTNGLSGDRQLKLVVSE